MTAGVIVLVLLVVVGSMIGYGWLRDGDAPPAARDHDG